MSDENKAKDFVSKFDTYDFLGYLIPGATFLLGIYLYGVLFEFNDLNELTKFSPQYFTDNKSWESFISIASLLFFCCYVIGHVIASFSSAFIDKLLMERTYGYPFQHLFDKHLYPNAYIRRAQKFYKCIVLFLTLFIILLASRGKFKMWHLLCLIPGLFFLISKIVLTLMVLRDPSNPFSLKSSDDKWLQCSEGLWQKYYKKSIKWGVRTFDLFSMSVLAMFRMRKPFTIAFQKAFISKFNETFNLNAKELDTDVYWLTYSYICKNDPNTAQLIRHWLNLYGFSRNLSMSFMLLFFYAIICNQFNSNDYYYYPWIILTGGMYYVLLLRYYYLYYNYYSKFLFRAFLACSISNEKE